MPHDRRSTGRDMERSERPEVTCETTSCMRDGGSTNRGLSA